MMQNPEMRQRDPADAANRDASRVRMRALRERRRLADDGSVVPEEPKKERGFPRTVWTPEETEQIKACLAAHFTRYQIKMAILTKTIRQIDTKIQSLGQSTKHTTGGPTPHGGGGQKAISRPSARLIEDRDALLNADYAAEVHLDPNVAILGDPSPARRAMMDRLNAQQLADETRKRPTLSMSAVPASRLGETCEPCQITRIAEARARQA